MEAALGTVFAVDRQLIDEGTYFVAEDALEIVGCGGWSKRKAMFGGSQGRAGTEEELDPVRDPARIRAFFVHPASARRGIGRAILNACELAMVTAGFTNAELVATLAGEPLYSAFGYQVLRRYELPLGSHLQLPVVLMAKKLSEPARPVGD